jgi:hypothetical protein
MAYGHAERNLAAIRQLEAETRELLSGLPQLDLEQLQWLQETAEARPEPARRHEGSRDQQAAGCQSTGFRSAISILRTGTS